jgi:hypothetical protein
MSTRYASGLAGELASEFLCPSNEPLTRLPNGN